MKTLIILHGWQSSKERWSKVKALVEEAGIRVLCMDIPGFKANSELKEPWTLDNYINWFSDFVAEQSKIYPDLASGFFLLGHSFGGRMTIKIASKKLFNLKGIILVSAAGIKPNPTLHKEIMGLGAKLVRVFKIKDVPVIKNIYSFFRVFFYHYILKKTDYLNAKEHLHETIINVLDEDLSLLLDKIDFPTKIIWGSLDLVTPLKDARLMNQKIKNSELQVLEGIKHTPYIECPEKLAKAILDFINKQ